MKTSACALASVVLLGLSLAACDKHPAASDKGERTQSPATKAAPQIVIETTSPDLAVKSWWKVFDLIEKTSAEECHKDNLKKMPILVPYFTKVTQEDMLRDLMDATCLEETYSRDIQEVKIESETRAIVFAKVKNVTPVPAGAELDEHDKTNRKDGFRFKYLVEKTSEGWKVSQVYRYDEHLQKDPWNELYEASDKPYYSAFVFRQ